LAPFARATSFSPSGVVSSGSVVPTIAADHRTAHGGTSPEVVGTARRAPR
jgi:hypothetical protein